MRVTAVILAAGSGVRLGSDNPKQLMKVAGKSVLEHTLEVFEAVDAIDEIIIVTRADLVAPVRSLVSRLGESKVGRVIAGGSTRNDSTRAALEALNDQDDGKILLHDAVRPFVDQRIILECIETLDDADAVDVAIASADTIIEVDQSSIRSVPERGSLRRGQTPQGFRLPALREAYRLAAKDPDFRASDDCGVVSRYLPDVEIRVVEGADTNIKITHPIDVYLADKLFQLRTLDQMTLDTDELAARLRGRQLVVFGGGYGIGAEIADLAEEMGAHCHRFSRSLTGTHIEDIGEVRKALAEVHETAGEIEFVVNSAGLLRIKALHQQSDEDIEALINVNYLGAINVARAALPYLAETRGQLLCFTSSSFTRGRAFYSVYSSTKAAVVNLVQALSEEWAELGVRANCMNPERAATPMRTSNFGAEDPATLLSARAVAEASLRTLASNVTGQVIDVRL